MSKLKKLLGEALEKLAYTLSPVSDIPEGSFETVGTSTQKGL